MKQILAHLRSEWYKYLLELIVITAGVLGAFMLNGWKESLEARNEEVRILMGLKQEFEVNLSEVQRNIELNTKAVESSIRMVELIRSPEPFANQDYFDSLMWSSYMYGTFDAQTGLVDEVISSGKLSVLSDANLRNRLTSISGLLDNLEEDYTIRSGYYMDHIIYYLNKYLPLSNFDSYTDYSSWSATFKPKRLTKSPFKVKFEEIDLLQLENLYYHHKINNDFVNLDEAEINVFLTETLEIINKNIKAAN